MNIPDDYARRKREAERYVSVLQRLPRESRWICAAQNLVQARSQGLPARVGRWEMRARRLLRTASAVGLGAATVVVVNVIFCIGLYFYQIRHRAIPAPVAILVGIHAARESALYDHFKKVAGAPTEHIDERDVTEFFRHGRVSLFDLYRELACVWRAAFNTARRPPGFSDHDIRTVVLMRAHQYAFLCAWFKRHLQASGNRTFVGCSTAGLASHAAVKAGAKTIYMLHGFQRHSLVYPEFSACHCFTAFDATHLRRRLPDTRVEVRHEWQPFLETCRVAAIAGDTSLNLELIRPFIDWALQIDMPVVVRRHPADRSSYWERWRHVVGVTVLEPAGRFEEFLAEVRPRILASWYSTALHDAFVKGVVPVTVSPVDTDVIDTVFPIYDIALRWPADCAVATKLIDNSRARTQFFAQRRNLVTGDPELANRI